MVKSSAHILAAHEMQTYNSHRHIVLNKQGSNVPNERLIRRTAGRERHELYVDFSADDGRRAKQSFFVTKPEVS